MDTKWRSFSHSIITKIIVFVIVILCYTGAITTTIITAESNNGDFDIIFEDSYFNNRDFMRESGNITKILADLIGEYKNKEHILSGGAITEDEIRREEESLFHDFRNDLNGFDSDLSNVENYNRFEEIYADKISQARERLINNDLKVYNDLLRRLSKYKGIFYYASDGSNLYTNSSQTEKEFFRSHPAYMMFDKKGEEVVPTEIKGHNNYLWVIANMNQLEQKHNAVYIAFTEEYLNSGMKEWQDNKENIINNLYKIGAFLLGLMVSFIYLVLIIGKKSFKDKEVHLRAVDRLYNDVNLGLCFGLIILWIMSYQFFDINDNFIMMIIPVTAIIATFGLTLVLSLVKHIKNRTFIKHTLIYNILNKVFRFLKDIYDNGSVGVKIMVIVVGYPILVALTFFIFPVTIGLGAWLALKRVKEFNAIKEGVETIKNGDIHQTIDVSGDGELGKLATNINSIAEGLNKAVDNELKSERLKTELITNVSHDIRTPLTSIITYIDLLKAEKDSSKVEQYIDIIDQKSQKLKVLTDDLFEASKASSGSIPVNLEKIDIVSLITQGLGELNDKIEESKLEFKINHSNDKVYILADGKLLWRVIENLLSNIFNYSLKGSRVYIDIEDTGKEVILIIKNISGYELNISAEELMERFKRGDESRSSQGSGLGLSIAKSLIDIQKGSFSIEIDGDLFKSIIHMPKYMNHNN